MILAAILLSQSSGPSLDLTLQPSGMFKLIGAYRPYRLQLQKGEPEGLNKLTLDSPEYGYIKVGERNYLVAFDGKNRIYFDRTGNADLVSGAPIEWTTSTRTGLGGKTYSSTEAVLTINLTVGGSTQPCEFHLYQSGGSVGYYEDFGMVGKLTVDGKSYETLYEDDTAAFDGAHGIFFVDEKGDGHIGPQDFHTVGEPFMLNGKEYEFGSANGTYALFPSTKKIRARIEQDPNAANGLKAGISALVFSAKTMDGEEVSFPDSFKGKLVMLDFWATWCGPCMHEVPNVVKAYNAFHDKGFEVLGISLDREGSAQQVRDVTAKNGMTWRQVYDGGYFSAAIAKRYRIQAIPEAYLVDGSTGKIIACGDAIRGEKLQPAIQQALSRLHNTESR